MATPTRSLQRLIYRSKQTTDVASDLDFSVKQIIQSAIRNNRIDNLTGLLITVQGAFVQTLEGPSEALMRTYQRISKDPRHSDLVVISSGLVEKRQFGEWNMCARALAPSDKAILDVLDAKGPFDSTRLTADSALRLLSAVADIQRRTALSALVA